MKKRFVLCTERFFFVVGIRPAAAGKIYMILVEMHTVFSSVGAGHASVESVESVKSAILTVFLSEP